MEQNFLILALTYSYELFSYFFNLLFIVQINKKQFFFIRFNKKNDVRKNNKKIFIDSKDLIEADFDEINEGDSKNE